MAEVPQAAGDTCARFTKRTWLIWSFAGVLVAAGAIGVSARFQVLRDRAERDECQLSLGLIASGLESYASRYQTFPLATRYGADCRPVIGWRFALSDDVGPYFFQGGLQYDEPWNSASNLGFAQIDLEVWKCPCEERTCGVSYFAIVRDDFVWRRDDTATRDEVTDDASSTILVVECCGTGWSWAEPGDVGFDEFMARFDARDVSCHEGGFHVAMVDGSVQFISYDTPRAELEAMFTIAGGE